jgi:hypothetical protein
MLAELPTNVKVLSRAEKLRLIELIAADLARQEEPGPATPSDFGLPSHGYPTAPGLVPIWSPVDAHAAAAELEKLIPAEASPK